MVCVKKRRSVWCMMHKIRRFFWLLLTLKVFARKCIIYRYIYNVIFVQNLTLSMRHISKHRAQPKFMKHMEKGDSMKLRKLIAVVLALVMVASTIPMVALTATAAAPTSYTSIAVGDTKSVSVTNSTGVYYRFIPNVTGIYRITSNKTSGDPYVVLLDASGNQLTYDDDSAGNRDFSLSYQMTSGTTYYIQARGFSGASAAYTMTLSFVSMASDGTIAAGQTLSVSVTASAPTKVYSFTPTVGGTYTFTSEGSIDTYGYVYSADGTLLESDDDDGDSTNFLIARRFEADTTYYLACRRYNSSAGTFNVKVIADQLDNGNAPQGGSESLVETTGGANTYTLFDSGCTGSGQYYSSTSNPAAGTLTNNGYDIYATASSNTINRVRIGRSVSIASEVTERATLSIYAYDVDESSGERDLIYLMDETADTQTQLSGYLSGRDGQWNTTTFYLDPALFTVGHTYHFELYESVSGWVVWVRNVALALTTSGGGETPPAITSHSFEASISNTGLVSTALSLTTSSAMTLNLEYAATVGGDQRGSALGETVSVTAAGATKNVSFQLESGSPQGTYQIDVIIKNGANVLATYTTTAGYAYRSVSYSANGGSNNLPLDLTAYSQGDTVTVLFDYVPSLEGYTFLGWSTDANATEPTYTQNGTSAFTMGASDVILYAVWGEIAEEPEEPEIPADEWDGSIANGFGGGTGTEQDPYLIYRGDQLAYLAVSVNGGNSYSGKYFKLMANIDLCGWDWVPIGSSASRMFSGNFDGNYHTIRRLKIEGSLEDSGLFGVVGSATISRLGVTDATVTVQSDSTNTLHGAILVGNVKNGLTLTECFVKGAVQIVSSRTYVGAGALIGAVYANVTMSDCYAVADVIGTANGNAYVGGLLGFNNSSSNLVTINRTYFAGTVCADGSAASYAGGMLGVQSATISNSFVSATITASRGSKYVNSFGAQWNSSTYTITNCYRATALYSAGSSVSATQGTATVAENLDDGAWLASNLGWDFDDVWATDADEDTPILQGFGSGAEEPPAEEPPTEEPHPVDVLVIMQDTPWNHYSDFNTMIAFLEGQTGRVNSVQQVTPSVAESMDFSNYHMIYVVADVQNSVSSYSALANELEAFALAGGVVLYGACYYGSTWDSLSIPGGVRVLYASGSNHNGTITDADHPIITGILSDGVTQTSSIFNGSALAHGYVVENTLPAGTNVILDDEASRPILVEYPLGDGKVVLTTMTWLFYFSGISSSGDYADRTYDDLLLYTLGLAEYSGNGGGGNIPHVHSYTDRVVPPTCTETGYTRHTCSCGDYYDDTPIPMIPHTMGAWIIDTPPTCTTSGRKHTECTECGAEIENVYMSPLTHNYTATVTRQVSCTTPGIITHACDRCGDSYLTYVYAEHNYVLTSRTEATCVADGHIVYTCTVCEDSVVETIEGGHTYEAEITTPATNQTEGLITYTCSICGDSYTEVIPVRPVANILLVQDRLPWGENVNAQLLARLQTQGYISGWDVTTTSAFEGVSLSEYSVIYIANDQTTASYNQLARFNSAITAFAEAGGVVVYGACDHGWSGGSISYTLPGGVTKGNYYSNYNYIADVQHNVVTGVLTDGKALTNALLYSTYSSHTYFNNLPADATTILTDSNGRATLAEYSLGAGHVIVSGLTWEYTYVRNFVSGTSFAKSVYDDLLVHAVSLSNPCDHAWDEGQIVPPSCEEDGYTLHTCLSCGAQMRDSFVSATGHVEGEWEVESEATAAATGLRVKRCTTCGEIVRSEIIPMLDAAVAYVESANESVVLGDEIELTIRIEDCASVTSLAVAPIFDTDLFELVSMEWLIGASIQDVDEAAMRAVSAWGSAEDVNTAVFKITLRAKALSASATVGATVQAENDIGIIALTVMPCTVSVVMCPHTETEFCEVDGEYHAEVCIHCGFATMSEHRFGADWMYDDSAHWHACLDCGAADVREAHSFEHDGDANCDCGYERFLRGDVNGDGIVDADDATLVTYHIFFGSDLYPVNQGLDFNGDGLVNSRDSVYLLYYYFFGAGAYPLS